MRKRDRFAKENDKGIVKVVLLMEKLFRCPRCIRRARKHGHSLTCCGHITLIGKKAPRVFRCPTCRKEYTGQRVFELIMRRLNKGLPPLLGLLLISSYRTASE